MPPEVASGILSAAGAGASALGIGSGGQDIKPIGAPGTVERNAAFLEGAIKDVLQASQNRVNRPIVFPGFAGALQGLTGDARIAGLPTGTLGLPAAATSLVRRRTLRPGLEGLIFQPEDQFPGSGVHAGGTDGAGGGGEPKPRMSSLDTTLLTIQSILDQAGVA